MTNIIEEGLVTLGFDNSKFSAGVQDTIGQCKKLEESISFKNANALSGLDKAVKKFDISPLTKAFDLFGDRAAWAESTAINCMVRIENKFLNFAAGITQALTIDPIKAGLNTYETKINAVQTIMSATGEEIDVVEKKINELNKYSDDTIYSFTDMTQNIGKFTNAGIKLDDAVAAIKGISNAAAMAGANTQELSRCMYNVSQSMAMGYVQYIDWKSVENANMATKQFKQEIADVGVAMGTVTKVNDDLYEVAGKQYNLQALFKDALKDQWLSNDVLLTTLKKYSDGETELGKKAYSAAQDIKTFSQMMDVLKESAATKWAGTFQILIGNLEEAKKMLKQVAAPLTDMMEQSAQFRNGMLTKAFTNGFDELNAMINKSGLSYDDFEKKLINHARVEGVHIDSLIEKYEDLEGVIMAGEIDKNIISDVLTEMSNTIEDTATNLTEETYRLEHFQKIVKRIQNSKWDSTYEEQKALQEELTKAGYNYAGVGALINKVINDQTLDIKELSVAEMQNLGYTEEQISMLTKYQLKLGGTTDKFQEMLNQMGRANVRFIWLDTLRSAFETLKNIIGSIQNAFAIVFGTKLPDAFQKCADSVHNFVTSLEINKDRAAKLTSAFTGIFNILDALFYCAKSGFNFIFKIVKLLMPSLNINLGDMADNLGNAGERFNNFVRSIHPLENLFDKISPKIIAFRKAVASLMNNVKEYAKTGEGITSNLADGMLGSKSKVIKAVGKLCKSIFDEIKYIFTAKSSEAGTNVLVGSVIESFTKVFSKMADLATELIDRMASFFSPNGEDGKKLATAARGVDFSFILKFGLFSTALVRLAKTIKTLMSTTSMVTDAIKTAIGQEDSLLGNLAKFTKNIYRLSKAARFALLVETVKAMGVVFVEIGASVLLLAAAARILNGVKWDSLAKVTGLLGLVTGVMLAIVYMSSVITKDAKAIGALNSLMNSGLLLTLSICLGLITGVIAAMTLLMKHDAKHTIMGGIAVVILMAEIFGGLALLLKASTTAKPSAILSLSLLMGVITVAMLSITASVFVLGKMRTAELVKGGVAVAIIMAVLVGICVAVTASTTKIEAAIPAIISIGVLIGTISGSVLLIAAACLIMNKVDWSAVGKMATCLVLITALASGLMLIASEFGNGLGALAAAALVAAFSSSLILIALGIRELSKCSENDIAKAIIVMGTMGLIFAVLLVLSKGLFKCSKSIAADGGKTSDKSSGLGAGLLIIAFSVSLLLIAKGIQELAKIPTMDIIKGVAVITYLSVVMGALLLCAKSMDKMDKNSTTSLIAIVALIGVLTLCCIKLGELDANQLTTALGALTWMVLLIEGLIAVVNLSKNVVSGNGATMIASVSLMLITISLSLSKLAKYTAADLLGAVLAMSLTLGAIVGVLAILNTITQKNPNLKNLLKIMKTLTGLIAAIGVALALVEAFGNGVEAITAATALSITMLAMTAVIAIINKLGEGGGPKSIGRSVVIIATMSALMVAIGYMYGKMSTIDGKQMNRIGLALVEAMVVIVGLCGTCAGLGYVGPKAIVGLGILLLVLGALAALAVGTVWVGIKFIMSQKANLETVGSILNKFGKDVEPLSDSVKGLNSKSLDSITALLTVFAEVSKIQIERDSVTKMSTIDEFTAFLPKLAENMANFSKVLTEANFDAELVNKAAIAAETISAIYDHLPKSGGKIDTIFGTAMDLETFIDSFKPLGTAIKAFAKEVVNEDLDYDLVNKALGCANTLSELANNLPKKNGVLQTWFGQSEDLKVWGTNLGNFGRMCRIFAQNVRGIGEEVPDYGLAQDAANMGNTLASLENTLPKRDGKLQTWLGNSATLSEWCGGIGYLGRMLRLFAQNVRGVGEQAPDYNLANEAAAMGKTLASLQNHLPESGGKFETWFGKKETLEHFSTNISKLGSGLSSFYWSVKDVGPDHSKKCVEVLETISALEGGLPDEGSFLTRLFTKKQDLSGFAGNLSALGKGLSAMSEECAGVTGMEAGKMLRLCQALTTLCENTSMEDVTYISQYDPTTLDNLYPNIVAICDAGIYFANKFKTVNTTNMESAANAIATLMSMSNGLASSDFSGFSGFISSFDDAAVDALSAFTNTFYDSESDVYDALDFFSTTIINGINEDALNWSAAASTMIYWFNSGLMSLDELKKVKEAGKSVGKEARTGINEDHMFWFSTGQNCVSGFIDGIKADLWHAAWIGDKLGADTLEALRKALDIHSPSKLTYQVGQYFVEGLSNGITSEYDSVTGISGELGDSMAEALKSALDDTRALLDNTSDELRITPVVDLSNVRDASKSMDKMFATSPEISAKLTSASGYTNKTNSQYAALVNALGNLTSGETINNTYNVNGITYDDGSNVATAISSLITAANISRRV